MSKWLLVAALVLATPAVVLGACPNKCSGHGSCSLNDVCECMQNWIGGDCSQRQCPFARAWHDTAQGIDDAHYYAECSNRGTCDRETGECSCDEGFVGSGCRRMACPAECSGHGTCDFIEEMAQNTFDKRIGGVAGRTYELWDQEKIMGCTCDPGYEGHDCSMRICPKGDDQLTPNQYDMKQAIVIDTGTATGNLIAYLTYYDPYGNAYTTEAFKVAVDATTQGDAGSTCENLETALRRLPNNVLNTVSVEATTSFQPFERTDPSDPTGAGTVLAAVAQTATPVAADPKMCVVTFTSEPGTTGYQHLFDCHVTPHNTVGQHPVTTGSSDATCTVYEVYPTTSAITAGTAAERPLTELAACSGRGICDSTTGTCACFSGHMGLACEEQEALV